MGKFYRYIYKKHNGFQIQYKGTHYGWYDDIRWALYDRDKLESCNWDLEEFVWLPESYNKYLDMPLPPRELDNYRQYISVKGNSFQVVKRINGKQEYFGSYKSLEEAIKVRDELIKKGWKK